MAQPKELTIAEIRQYMLDNGCKVTNHSLVKHFKRFLTHPQTQNEARKQFKTYVNILSTIKNEDNQKYLILRKKYINESPSDEVVERAVASATNETAPSSPGGGSIISDGGLNSPFRQPPPYKPPPDVTPNTTPKAAAPTATTGINVHQEHVDNYRDCVNEFNENYSARQKNSGRLEKSESSESANIDANKNAADNNHAKSISRSSSVDETNNKENIPRFSFSSGMSLTSTDSSGPDKASGAENEASENPMSVKEATRKFNRLASEEESRIISPPAKKKPEKELIEEKALPEVILPPLKIKEWIVSMSKANYQELVKLANEHPELVKIQDPATGYTALHWAAKHGNEDVVKLIAGTYKADVNARTNGGYTPLHLAIQFGRDHIFELLWNVYKANRDLMDWSGNKPLDYSQQRPSVSASTCSSEYRNYFYNTELNSNFHLGDQWSRNTSPRGGGSIGSALTRNKKRSHLRYATVAGGTGGGAMSRTQSLLRTGPSRRQKKATVQSMFLRDEDEEKDLLPRSILLLPNVPTNNNNNNNTIKSAQSELSKSANTTDDDETSDQLPNSTSTKDNTGTFNTSTRRKESFLRKTFRAAANRHNSNNVTNQMPTK